MAKVDGKPTIELKDGWEKHMASLGDIRIRVMPELSTGAYMEPMPIYANGGYVSISSNRTDHWNGLLSPPIPHCSLNPTPEKSPKKEKRMRGLFEVFVVNPETDECNSQRYVADDEMKARMKAAQLLPSTTDLDSVDIIVRRIGDVRAKPRVKEVRVLKD